STGGIVDVNRRAYEGSGYTREELLTMHVTDIEESLDEEGIRRLWDRLNGEELAGEPVTLEGIHRYRDGRRLPVEVRVGLVELGTETLMLALVRDITSRKRAENELREREEMIRALVETSQDWIWSIDLQGTHTYCNPAVESILGYRPDELVDKPALSLVHDEDRAKIEAMLPACIAGKRGWTNLLSRWRARNGGWRFLESNAVPILDENGELVGFRGVDRDTTDRKQAEEALRKSEATYRTFFENSCDAIQILVNGVFVDYNAATVALLGYADRTELVNTTPEGLSPEHQPDGRESAEKAREMVETARRQGTHRFEWDHMGKDGEILPVEVALTALSRDGDATLYSVWRDLRGRKQAEEEREALEAQLRQSQKMEAIGKLAGGVAHDFNNLLQAILGYGEMALEETEEGSTLQEDLLEVVKAGNSATVLTRQLLAFSRRQVLSLEVVDLHDVVEEIAKMIRRVIGEHIALRIVAAPGLKLVYADRGQLEQILMNLCVNARDAMPEGGELTVRTAAVELDDAFCQTHGWGAPGRCVQLSVKDTGVGMDEETQRRIFEPFYTTKESGKGTGLGLSTVYGIVRQHNGLVLVRSEPGKGSAFRVFLPPSRGRAEGQREAAAATPSGGTEVILLAEDSESVRLLGTRFLETAGYTVLAAADGHEAIRVFDAHRDTIDMAMLDVVMPGCSGRAVLHHIRESGSSIPALVASGYSSSQLQEGLAIEEDVERIAKPYQRGELLRRIREILDA
ncbi:MAG: PAS domain S-box protein, partial [Victivallales bacterium]|nr:PAS domain S-box protein [Victivallales bacterium]